MNIIQLLSQRIFPLPTVKPVSALLCQTELTSSWRLSWRVRPPNVMLCGMSLQNPIQRPPLREQVEFDLGILTKFKMYILSGFLSIFLPLLPGQTHLNSDAIIADKGRPQGAPPTRFRQPHVGLSQFDAIALPLLLMNSCAYPYGKMELKADKAAHTWKEGCMGSRAERDAPRCGPAGGVRDRGGRGAFGQGDYGVQDIGCVSAGAGGVCVGGLSNEPHFQGHTRCDMLSQVMVACWPKIDTQNGLGGEKSAPTQDHGQTG